MNSKSTYKMKLIEEKMKKIILIVSVILIQACVVPVTIGNKIESSESEIKERVKNSPEIVSPEIYQVLADYDDYIVLMATFEPGKSDKMHYHGNLFYYVVEGGLVQITLPDGTVNTSEIQTGFLAQQEAGTEHMVKNIGNSTVKVLAVEEK